MVNIEIGKRNKVLYVLDMRGHARDESGGDPCVCAACSAIAYALLGWVCSRKEEYAPVICEAPGNMYIELKDGEDKCAAAWEMAEIGLRQLAQAYPQYVCVKDC